MQARSIRRCNVGAVFDTIDYEYKARAFFMLLEAVGSPFRSHFHGWSRFVSEIGSLAP
jgi:hypothetical protein